MEIAHNIRCELIYSWTLPVVCQDRQRTRIRDPEAILSGRVGQEVDRLDQAPADPGAALGAADVGAEDLSPLPCGLVLALVLHQPVVAAVALLLQLSAPGDVSGLVALVVVDPVERELTGGAGRHVSQEIAEILTPSVADSDPPGAVDPVLLMVIVVATVDHLLPAVVKLVAREAVTDVISRAHLITCLH